MEKITKQGFHCSDYKQVEIWKAFLGGCGFGSFAAGFTHFIYQRSHFDFFPGVEERRLL